MLAVVEVVAVLLVGLVIMVLALRFVVGPAMVRAREQEYQRAVEAEVSERLTRERFEADVQRRLHEARDDDGSLTPLDQE